MAIMPIRRYVMWSMIFGAIYSPCCAEYVKNINAVKLDYHIPRGVAGVINYKYVDDLVISFSNANEAERSRKKLLQ